MGNLLGHRLDAVAAILRNKPFDPLVVIAIQDQVLRAADYGALRRKAGIVGIRLGHRR
jgi:hypothetical protein